MDEDLDEEEPEAPPVKKRVFTDLSAGSVGGPSPSEPVVPSIPVAQIRWGPLLVQAKWQDTSLTNHQVTVALMPGGVAYEDPNQIQVKLDDGAMNLMITFNWPDFVASGEFLDALKIALEEEHEEEWNSMGAGKKAEAVKRFNDNFVLMATAIRKELALLRPIPNEPVLRATTRLKLDCAVNPITFSDWHVVGEDSGERVLIVDLQSPNERSYVTTKKKSITKAPKKA